jgi:hypothetical protein
MPRLSDVMKNLVPLPVPYRGTVITVTYKPESVTSDQQSALEQRVADGSLKRDDMDAAMIVDSATGWDLTDGPDDQPVPFTFEVVRARSRGMLLAIVQAIYDDQRNPQQGR